MSNEGYRDHLLAKIYNNFRNLMVKSYGFSTVGN